MWPPSQTPCDEGVAAVADADAEGPDADHGVEFAVGGGEAGGEAVGVVDDGDRGVDAVLAQLRR